MKCYLGPSQKVHIDKLCLNGNHRDVHEFQCTFSIEVSLCVWCLNYLNYTLDAYAK